MAKVLRLSLTFILAVISFDCGFLPLLRTQSLDVVPIDVSVLNPPIVFKADGRWDMAYELRISSLADVGDTTISSIQLLDPSGKPLVDISGDVLKGCLDPGAAVGTRLGPRTFTTIFMWVSASSLTELPAVLRHRVAVRISDEHSELSTDTPAIRVDRRPVVVISPPLRGGDWVAENGPSNSSVHRRAILPLNGRSYIGQRFAIDWAQTYADGSWYRGDLHRNQDYRSYGQPVYAVADGTITEVKDGIPENTPGTSSRAVEITFETLAGNHVIERIGEGVYATYAHLQPGSVRVKLGARVHRGQMLGLLGNSGNSDAPHLHFQICDVNSVLGCEGLPYAISSFDVEGRWKPDGSVTTHSFELPTEGEVVRFNSGH
jgi:hypothetical protein